MLRRVLTVAVVTALPVGALTMMAPAAQARAGDPAYEMPFPCQQKWTGSTRSSHSPSKRSIDFNRTDDLDDLVTASAAGRVSTVVNLGRRSYGLYVKIDHVNGRSTLYAHLSAAWVVAGQAVDQGQVIGQVGRSGKVTGSHLHFEQRLGSKVVVPYFHAAKFVMPRTQASASCADVPIAGDWNGDGTAEVGAFRRTPQGSFLRRGGVAQVFGEGSDAPVVGDWDGDGTTDAGVRRGLTNINHLSSPDGTSVSVPYGSRGDLPISGDWNGDGTDEIGIYHPPTSDFFLRDTAGQSTVVRFGSAAGIPVTGDWNGDRITDLGSFNPSTATWTLRYLDSAKTAWTATVAFGVAGDLPVTGDWDGDGRTNLGTWTPATATYTLRQGDATSVTAPAVAQKYGRAR